METNIAVPRKEDTVGYTPIKAGVVGPEGIMVDDRELFPPEEYSLLEREMTKRINSLAADNVRLSSEGNRWKELCASMLIHVEPGAGRRRAESYEAEYNALVSTGKRTGAK